MRAIAPPEPKQRLDLPTVCVLLVVGTSLMWGVGVLDLRGINIAPWDWASLIIGALWIFYSARNRLKVTQTFLTGLFLAFLFTAWMGVSAFVSPQLERALTMIFIQMRNLLLFFCVATLFASYRSINLVRLNTQVFYLGVVIALTSIIIYIPAVMQYTTIISNPALWKPGIGYALDQGGVLRLIGLSKDPNFYSTFISFTFFAGITSSKSRLKWLGIAIIALSLILAMSRAFAVVLPISILILLAPTALSCKIRKALKAYIKSIFLGAVFALMLGVVWGLFQGNLWQSIMLRMELASGTPRFTMWEKLIELIKTDFNPVIGKGLRSAEEALGGAYSHNSYLDILFETGMIGFTIWSLFIGFVTALAFKRLSEPGWAPWVHSWLIVLGMFLSLSAAYHPFSWMLAAVILGSREKAKTYRTF